MLTTINALEVPMDAMERLRITTEEYSMETDESVTPTGNDHRTLTPEDSEVRSFYLDRLWDSYRHVFTESGTVAVDASKPLPNHSAHRRRHSAASAYPTPSADDHQQLGEASLAVMNEQIAKIGFWDYFQFWKTRRNFESKPVDQVAHHKPSSPISVASKDSYAILPFRKTEFNQSREFLGHSGFVVNEFAAFEGALKEQRKASYSSSFPVCPPSTPVDSPGENSLKNGFHPHHIRVSSFNFGGSHENQSYLSHTQQTSSAYSSSSMHSTPLARAPSAIASPMDAFVFGTGRKSDGDIVDSMAPDTSKAQSTKGPQSAYPATTAVARKTSALDSKPTHFTFNRIVERPVELKYYRLGIFAEILDSILPEPSKSVIDMLIPKLRDSCTLYPISIRILKPIPNILFSKVYHQQGGHVSLLIRKRYSQFLDLYARLQTEHKHLELPPFPEKVYIDRYHPLVLKERHARFSALLDFIVLHPTLSSSDAFAEFVCL